MTLQCELCPKRCRISPGQSGECRVRANLDGRLVALTYGHPCTVHVDPIEKKPFYHFQPGSRSLSLATVGCNLHCLNCQNWEISQQNPEDIPAYALSPDEIATLGKEQGCASVAATYTDPVVYYEYALDCAKAARLQGLKSVLVTAAYINPEPWIELCKTVDAVRIDLKALSETFYERICGASLRPVLNALLTAQRLGVHMEIINLLIPTLNDSDRDISRLCRWIVENLGSGIPLHFSRFFPHYRMKSLPPTSPRRLLRAREIARDAGLDYVYLGNILLEDGASTFCPKCNRLLIERRGFQLHSNALQSGRCPDCSHTIYGVWQ